MSVTENDERKLDVLPWLAAGALVVAVAALSFADVALRETDDEGSAGRSTAMGPE